MRPLMVLLCTAMIVTSSVAAERVDFWRVREGSGVVLVLGTGGECEGRVARRLEGALDIALTRANAACGAQGSMVTVRESNTRAVERAEAPRGKKVAKRAAAVGVAGGTGAVLANVSPRVSFGIAAAGLEAIHILNDSLRQRDKAANRYVMYVSRLDAPSK